MRKIVPNVYRFETRKKQKALISIYRVGLSLERTLSDTVFPNARDRFDTRALRSRRKTEV